MKLIKFFSIVFCIAIICVFITSYMVKVGIRKSNTDFYGKMTAACDPKKETNLLLIGNSRALNHLVPKVFDSITMLNAYNYGVDAAAVKTCYNLIQAAIHNQKNIKGIVLNIDYNMFRNDDPYKDAYYFAYEGKIPDLMRTDTRGMRFMHSLRIFDISMFDDPVKFAAAKQLIQSDARNPDPAKGFLPRFSDTFALPLKKHIIPGRTPITEEGISVFKKIIETCKKRNIALLFILAPYHKYHPRNFILNYDSVMTLVTKIAKDNDVPFYDYSTPDLTADITNYVNFNHLSLKGATLFSIKVATDFRNVEMKRKNDASEKGL